MAEEKTFPMTLEGKEKLEKEPETLCLQAPRARQSVIGYFL